MKNLLLKISPILLVLLFSSCKKKISSCFTMDNTAYLVGDTIFVDASCSKDSKTYLWEPGNGLTMLSNGTSSKESFVITNLPGVLSRTISLTVSNSKSTRQKTESVAVF